VDTLVFYKANMFGTIEVEKSPTTSWKPMKPGPGHILIYKSKLRSYRESSGAGWRRAGHSVSLRAQRRACTDCCVYAVLPQGRRQHIFCPPNRRSSSEVEACVDFAFAVMRNFGFEKFEVELLRLGTPHIRKIMQGKPEDWQRAHRRAFANTMNRMNIPYKKIEGEAAFLRAKN